MTLPWKLKGDFLISCNCDIFCPCVLSLGKARPTQGICHSWFGFRIAEGHAGPTRLDGFNAAFMMLSEANNAQFVYRSDAVHPRHRANFRVFDPLDFLAEVSAHIPDAHEKTTLFYGRS